MNLPITSSLSAELAKPFPRVAINSNQHINISKATSTTTTEILKHQAIYPKVNHIYNDQGKWQTLDTLRRSKHNEVEERALSNRWGHLAQGNEHGIQATDTIKFIKNTTVPPNRDITYYASFVCDHRPLKSEPWRVQIVVGGDKLTYSNDTGSPAASLLETKILLNSTMLQKGQDLCAWI